MSRCAKDSITSDFIDYFKTPHNNKTEVSLLEAYIEIRETIEAGAIELAL